MECQKIMNLLDTTSDNVPRINIKKWIDDFDQSGEYNSLNSVLTSKPDLKYLC